MIWITQVTTAPLPQQTQSASLEDWIAGMAAGDAQALESLYRETKTAVYGFALSIVGSPPDAEDVMQDAYVRIYQAAGSYRPQGKPMAWVLTVVRNTALMRLRARRELPLPEENLLPAGEDMAVAGTDRVVLKAALEELSEQERQIVILHSVTGLKHREIADLLEMPLATALSKYHRALKKLRKKL